MSEVLQSRYIPLTDRQHIGTKPSRALRLCLRPNRVSPRQTPDSAKIKTSLLLSLPALALAYPGMTSSKDEILHHLKQAREAEAASKHEKRQDLVGGVVGTLTGTVGTLVNDVKGLLGNVAAVVDPDNYRPKPGYTFQAPGPGDSRGPCPGLNLRANYCYLPRNGYVNHGQFVEATA